MSIHPKWMLMLRGRRSENCCLRTSKRQSICRGRRSSRKTAVSYTHLDVYKRQHFLYMTASARFAIASNIAQDWTTSFLIRLLMPMQMTQRRIFKTFLFMPRNSGYTKRSQNWWRYYSMADIAASVLARLKNKAKEAGRSYQLCLQLLCQEEFLRRLEKSKYAENLVLKRCV